MGGEVDSVIEHLCRYYLSLAHITSLFPGMLLLQQISSFSDLCSTAILRSVNGVLAVLCSILIYETITELWPALDRKRATFYAVILSLYPLHWFFTYLYYTDVASLIVFLAMYLMSLKKRYLLSALVRDSLNFIFLAEYLSLQIYISMRSYISIPAITFLCSSCSLVPWQYALDKPTSYGCSLWRVLV